MTKAEFLKKYAHCASNTVLQWIWEAKENRATELNLVSCNIFDLSPLSELNDLEYLDVSCTPVVDLSPLSNLVNLRFLQFSETQIANLAPIARLTNLDDLDFSNTLVTDLSPILPLIESGRAVWCGGNIPNFGGIKAHYCPIDSPPYMIVEQGSESIIQWFAKQ